MKDFEDILKALTVVSKDNGEEFTVTDRVEAIRDLLSGSSWKLQAEGSLCLIYSKEPLEDRDIVLVTSHVDSVYDRCFCKDGGEGLLLGTFDNSLTNAAVVADMLEDRFPDHVAVAFTGDEEQGSNGCYEAISLLGDCGASIVSAVVTDVTAEGWENECSFSIENDFRIDMLTAHRILDTLLDSFDFSFQHEAEPDESWDFDEEEIPSFTVCFPVKGDMHSEEGVLARKGDIGNYCEALARITELL